MERNEVAMVVLFGLVVNLLGVDVLKAFLARALIRYNQLNFKRKQLHMCQLSHMSSAQKHVEGFSEQFFNCLRRYVGKHVAP